VTDALANGTLRLPGEESPLVLATTFVEGTAAASAAQTPNSPRSMIALDRPGSNERGRREG
jgi:hypothetical protein